MTNQEIYDLITRFETSSIHTMKLYSGDFSMELQKDSTVSSCPPPAAVTPVPETARKDHAITAPLVGTYYAAPAPDAPAFVRVGDKVNKGDTVCLIEAMKTISEIPALRIRSLPAPNAARTALARRFPTASLSARSAAITGPWAATTG